MSAEFQIISRYESYLKSRQRLTHLGAVFFRLNERLFIEFKPTAQESFNAFELILN